MKLHPNTIKKHEREAREYLEQRWNDFEGARLFLNEIADGQYERRIRTAGEYPGGAKERAIDLLRAETMAKCLTPKMRKALGIKKPVRP